MADFEKLNKNSDRNYLTFLKDFWKNMTREFEKIENTKHQKS